VRCPDWSGPRLVEGIAVPIVAADYRLTDYRLTDYRLTDYRLTDYRLTDYRRFIGFVHQAVRPQGRDRFNDLVREINLSLRGYLVGQVTLSAVGFQVSCAILRCEGERCSAREARIVPETLRRFCKTSPKTCADPHTS